VSGRPFGDAAGMTWLHWNPPNRQLIPGLRFELRLADEHDKGLYRLADALKDSPSRLE
jgi:hypothetical protein